VGAATQLRWILATSRNRSERERERDIYIYIYIYIYIVVDHVTLFLCYVSSSFVVVCHTFRLRVWKNVRKIKNNVCVLYYLRRQWTATRNASVTAHASLSTTRPLEHYLYRWLTCIGVFSESSTIYSEGDLISRTPEVCTQPSWVVTVDGCLRLPSSEASIRVLTPDAASIARPTATLPLCLRNYGRGLVIYA